MIRTFLSLGVLAVVVGAASAEDVTLDKYTSKTPASWKMQEPSNKFRAYQFAIPKAKGDAADAELVVSTFGPGSGGSLEDNIKRWKAAMEAAEGKSIDDVTKVEKIKLDGANLTVVDITGTYLSKFPPFDPNAKVTRKMNYRRIAVFFDSPKGPYFIIVTGPAATVTAAKADFDAWLKNFK